MHPMRRGLMRLTPLRKRPGSDIVEQLQKLTAEVAHFRREAACRQMIGNVIARYFMPLEVPADLVRLSVGIETADDLIEDLRSALERGRPGAASAPRPPAASAARPGARQTAGMAAAARRRAAGAAAAPGRPAPAPTTPRG